MAQILFRTKKRGDNYLSIWTMRSRIPGKTLKNIEHLIGGQNKVHTFRDSNGANEHRLGEVYRFGEEIVIMGVIYDNKYWKRTGAIVEAKVVSPWMDSTLVRRVSDVLYQSNSDLTQS